MTFKVGDTVTRIKRPFRDMAVGDTGKVIASTERSICLEGYTVAPGSPFPTKFDPTCFKLASEPCADDHNAGDKRDNGKPRHGLVLGAFSNALTEVAKVGTFGANKYSDNGWLSVPNGLARYTDAMLRHHFAEAGGEELDEESGLRHAAHRAWNALAVLELALREKGAK